MAADMAVTTQASEMLVVIAPQTSGRESVWFQKRRPNCCGMMAG